MSEASQLSAPQSRRAAAARSLTAGPILPPLLRLAAPNLLVTTVYALVSGVDAYYIGKLGAEALAGISLVFPMVMLMQTMSVGAMGGGIASAIARAAGAGDRERADALAMHALLIGAGVGLLFTLGMLLGAGALFRLMGGYGESVQTALAYSDIFFGWAVLLWIFQSLAAILRGLGNMTLPAAVLVGGELFYVALAPALIFGIGPIPALGVRGAALLVVLLYVVRILVLLRHFLSAQSRIRLRLRGLRIRAALFWEILRVGIPSSVSTLLTNLNILIVTTFAGLFGAYSLAGYGVGARLEYMLAPIVFGLGSALVTMVGTNIGAGQKERALRVAWTGAGLAAFLTGMVGLACAAFPETYMRLFTSNAEVIAVGASYLRTVGPVYLFYGLGISLFFASQGAGKPRWPLVASVVRFAITAGVGYLAVHWLDRGVEGLFLVVAVAFVVFGSIVAIAVKAGAWEARNVSIQRQ